MLTRGKVMEIVLYVIIKVHVWQSFQLEWSRCLLAAVWRLRIGAVTKFIKINRNTGWTSNIVQH